MYMIKGPRARAARRQAQPGGGALKCGGSIARWSPAVTRACPVLLAPHSSALLPGSRGSPARTPSENGEGSGALPGATAGQCGSRVTIPVFAPTRTACSVTTKENIK